MDSVPEGVTSTHTFVPKDADGLPIQGNPSELSYKLSASPQDVLTDWTPLATDIREVKISATHNTIGARGSKRYLTIKAIYAGGDTYVGELEYEILDRVGIR